MASRSLVLVEDDGTSLRKQALELLERRTGRAAETVDRLVRIAHGKDVLLVPGQQLRQKNVARVRILKLVDEDKSCPSTLLSEERGIGFQQPDGPADHH